MPNDNENRCRFQKAVLWPVSPRYNKYGEPQVTAPVDVVVRIEKGRIETLDREGHKVAADSLLNVDRAIGVGSLIHYGTLSELSGTYTDLLQVIEYIEIPDLKARKYDRNIKVMRYKANKINIAPDLAWALRDANGTYLHDGDGAILFFS